MAALRGLRARTATWLVPVLATAAACAWGLGARQLWRDEASTWWAAHLSSADFGRLLGHQDAVLAPYYVFMRAWIAVFGDGEVALRAPSAIAMALTAGVIARLGTRLHGPAVGLRAGLIFAVLPMVSHFGQEARPYAFATLFASGSTLLLLRLRDAPDARGRAVAYAASIALLGLTHVLALLILPAHAACFVRAPRVRAFAIAAVAGAACAAPLLVLGATQAGQVPTFDLAAMFRHLGPLAIGLLAILLAASRWLLSSRQPVVLRAWAIVPPLVLLATHAVLGMFRRRYLAFTLPAWALLVAGAVEWLPWSPRARRVATAALVIALVAIGARAQLHLRTSHARVDSDYRAAAAIVRAHALPGDAIAFGGDDGRLRHARLALAYELRREPALDDVFVARTMAAAGRFAADECAACLPAEVERVWLVTSAAPDDLHAGLPRARARLLDDAFDVAAIYPAWHVTVALLIRTRR